MAAEDRTRWDKRYSSGDYRPRLEPTPLLEEAIGYAGPGKALVIACGAGRNALRLADAGFEVTGIDISPVAIDMARAEAARRSLVVDLQVGDVDEMSLSPETYDLITMIRYVNREIWSELPTALNVDGWLLMEQHLRTYRDVLGPSADYRVDAGELLAAFGDLRVIHYSEAIESSDRSDGVVSSARLLACKGDPGW